MSSTNTDNLIMSYDALVRAISVNKNIPHAVFLGAGASISSGVPSAATCVWEWKHKIFVSNNQKLSSQVQDFTLPGTQARIQSWLDSQGKYPHKNAPDEYGVFIEECYHIPNDRRKYFQNLVEHAKPYHGYQLLALLAQSDLIKSVWTSNFDGLTQKATILNGKVTCIDIALDSVQRIERSPARGELLHIALHGDYRYDLLKNTSQEIQDQDSALRDAFVRHCRDTSLIVCGYSGRDSSIIESFLRAFTQPGTGRLYWCGRDGAEPDSNITELIIRARESGREAFYIHIEGFDQLMRHLALDCLTGELHEKAKNISISLDDAGKFDRKPFMIKEGKLAHVIKSNAFPIDCPSEAFQFDAKHFSEKGAWSLLRETIDGADIVAVLLKGKVICFGSADKIRDKFNDKISGSLDRVPINGMELCQDNGAITSLFVQAMVRAIAAKRNLATDGKRLLWDAARSFRQSANGHVCIVYQGILLSLRRYEDKNYLIVKPTLKVNHLDGSDADPEDMKEVKRILLTKQHNGAFSSELDRWRDILFPMQPDKRRDGYFEFPNASGSAFRFIVENKPCYASIIDPRLKSGLSFPDKFRNTLTHKGVLITEPSLVFASHNGMQSALDPHPIRGILNNRPYDIALTQHGFNKELRLGVICPGSSSSKLHTYLRTLLSPRRPDSKAEYLLEYPGFAQAFGIPLTLPSPTDRLWHESGEHAVADNDVIRGSSELAQRIIASIRSICATGNPNVIIIFIPDNWRRWERYQTEHERFDLHDFIKAYCVQEGIATQFIRESTLSKSYQCEILWWLSLSFYSKSMRTPWLIESIDNDTAFMGFGYSLDARPSQNKHVVLGCSHIYSPDGRGLRYKLSKVNNPIWRQDNPFLSKEDARRVGEDVRQLVLETNVRLPSRLVIHKLTPFIASEREGLLEGLSGIRQIDMIEINIDPALRYIASRSNRDGGMSSDMFPVRRGTVVQVDRYKALLWVHGTTAAIDPSRNYYQGKSRIPAPLLMTRHYGSSDLEILSKEIMGLSKMNWNTFDMYTKLPATIQSSKQIARIGSLLERFGSATYDYRLFL